MRGRLIMLQGNGNIYMYVYTYVSAQQEIFTHLTFDGCEQFDAIYFDWISLPRQVAALSVCPSVSLSPLYVSLSAVRLSVRFGYLVWFWPPYHAICFPHV